MTPGLTILDANAVLRFLLRDIEEQALAAKEKIALMECRIPAEVIAEVVYVLGGVYGIGRAAIADKIEELIAVKDGLVEKSPVVSFASRLYAETIKLDFVDCLLAGYHAITGCSVFTFDKDLKKTIEQFRNPIASGTVSI
jgi:predicted nucleic-acid-binding protein